MSTSQKQKENDKKVQLLISEIQSKDEKKIVKALQGLKVHGSAKIIAPLIETWNSGISESLEQTIIEFIGDLKQSNTSDPIMECINNKAYVSIRQKLLSTIWNSKVDYSEYFVDFVRIAVEGDFMEGVECLTILENLEGPFEEYQFLDAQVELSLYAEQTNKEPRKQQIISEIALIVKDLERQHIAF